MNQVSCTKCRFCIFSTAQSCHECFRYPPIMVTTGETDGSGAIGVIPMRPVCEQESSEDIEPFCGEFQPHLVALN